ncbi:hypothetical protein GCM10011428_37500 [Streptomyces violaceus]
MRGLLETVMDLALVPLREVRDLALGRSQLGLHVVQETHRFTFPRAGRSRTGALAGLVVGRLVGGLLLGDVDAFALGGLGGGLGTSLGRFRGSVSPLRLRGLGRLLRPGPAFAVSV